MQIDTLETHDRLLEFQKQAELVAQGVQDCIDGVPDIIKYPFYVFGHPRTMGMDERAGWARAHGEYDLRKIPSTKLTWIPKPEKPNAVLNSYLLRAQKGTDIIQIIWILPPREIWDCFKSGQMTANESILTSINNYEHAKDKLEAPEPGDMDIDQRDDFRMKIKHVAIERQKQKITRIDEWQKI